ncbi:MAG: hypothetical protein IJZ13_05260 [Clostridia bacterium]|nr:hypothetical protein [Clostridia bacterium]
MRKGVILGMVLLLCASGLLSGCGGTNDPANSDAGGDKPSAVTTTDAAVSTTTGTGGVTSGTATTGALTSTPGTTAGATQGKTTAATGATITVAQGPVVGDKGLVRVSFSRCAGAIQVDKATRTVTVPVKGDENLAGLLPELQVSAGYTAKLVSGKDMNSTLVYTVSDGKVSERWTVRTVEDYTGLEEASSLAVMSVFGKGAVLQRDAQVRIFGTCVGADMVVVEFAGQRKRGPVEASGRWEVTLDPMPANNTAQTLTVSTHGETVECKSILVGDVWFCSGQSNMAYWPLNSQEAASLSKLKDSKNIRYFSVPKTWNKQPLDEFEGATVTWKNAATYGSEQWSMYALSFAWKLREQLDVPIGVVVSAEGGALIEYFLPDACLLAAGTSRNTKQPGHGIKQGVGTGMYNSMVYPLRGLTVKGILWYQGEANSNATSDYTRLFEQYAAHYRELFRDADLPIITTQLPKYGAEDYPNWVTFRTKQWAIAEAINNVHIVSAIDMGEVEDIHPADKWSLGMRAAELVLNKVYGKATPGESAYPASVKGSGTTVTIRFKDAESGLKLASGSAVQELYGITAAGKTVAPTSVKLQGDTLVLTMSEAVVRIDYAMKVVPEVNLYTGNGLPVAPFSLPVG